MPALVSHDISLQSCVVSSSPAPKKQKTNKKQLVYLAQNLKTWLMNLGCSAVCRTNCASSNSSYKEKSAGGFQFNLTSFYRLQLHGCLDCPTIPALILAHLLNPKRRIMPFCTCPDLVYAYSCGLEVRLASSLRSWRSCGLEILCENQLSDRTACSLSYPWVKDTTVDAKSTPNGPSANPLFNLSTKAALFLFVSPW